MSVELPKGVITQGKRFVPDQGSMTKEETWEKMVGFGIAKGGVPEGSWPLRGVALSGADLSSADLSGADLRKADLRGANLRRATLRGANLRSANLSGIYLFEADLMGANLFIANLFEAGLTGANLCGANLRRANLCRANLTAADLSKANLTMAYLEAGYLFKTNLSGANLGKANLSGANLIEANLSRANLSGSILTDLNFNLANLSGANLTAATYWGVSTTGWIIDGIKAKYLFFCRATEADKALYRRNFEQGQFEALFKSLPTVELILNGEFHPGDFLVLNAIIAGISERNPELGIKFASISQNEFETKVALKTGKDENLSEVAGLVQDAVIKLAPGIPLNDFVPYLNRMLPADLGEAIEKTATMQSGPVILNFGNITINQIKADGSTLSGPISQRSIIANKNTVNVVENYHDHKKELDVLFDRLKEYFSEYGESTAKELSKSTDRVIDAKRKGREVDKIQSYWEQIKEGIKTGGAAVSIAASIGHLLGYI